MEAITRNSKGRFITFEGPEGAGKSTQLELLRAGLAAAGREVVVTREPGGTPLAEQMREVLKHYRGPEPVTPVTELLLMAAARSQHVENLIRPALDCGAVVLCDRFCDSTAAYQGAGRGMDRALIDRLCDATVGDCRPDLTILLDLPPETGFRRTRRRAETAGDFDRFETEELAFHRRVRAEFLAIAAAEPERVRVVDAEADSDNVRRTIRRLVDAVL